MVAGYCMVLHVWRAESKEWTHPYPDMPTARSQCSAVAYNEWSAVAGGWNGESQSSVVHNYVCVHYLYTFYCTVSNFF